MADLNEVARVEKNSTTFIVFSTTEFRGETYVDVREFLETPDYKGPTKKGLRFRRELLDAVYEGLGKLKAAAGKPAPAEGEGGETDAS